MYKFLWKGIIRDKSRSLLPILVVAIGVFAVVFASGFIQGMLDNIIRTTADFQTGHLKVVTQAYLENEEQKPNDLALLNVDILQKKLTKEFPEIEWTPRIFFGGLLDIPNNNGETRAQGPVSATAYDLLSPGSHEAPRIGLQQSLVAGHAIEKSNEIIISYDFANRHHVQPGDTVTFFGSTMYGSMCFANYTVAGVARFGITQLDRGAVILDISDARPLLDMDNATGELFGFLPDAIYDKDQAEFVKDSFNRQYSGSTDEYTPVMVQLADQKFMGQMLAYIDIVSLVMVILLVFALAIVLWNVGILSGIRRYNEFGVRLAMGEEKKHIYRALLMESLFIGVIGSTVGTALGVSLCYFLQNHGIDYSAMMESVNMMIEPVIHARVTPELYFIGFIPGVLSILIGSALAGTAIYKRNTAFLFKELD